MKIANARTFGNQAYVTEADISSAISRHSTEMAHLDSDAVAKLSSIESGATYVDSSTVSGWGYTKLTNAVVSSIAGGVVSSVAYTKTEVDSRISSIESKVTNVYSYRGSVDYYSNLPTSGQQDGYVYNVVHADAEHGIAAGANVAWTGTGWDNLGGTIDLSEYALASNVADKAYQTIAVKSNSTATATNVVAGSKNATVTLVGADNVVLSANATNHTIAISAINSTYSAATTTSDGLMTKAMVTKLNGVASNAEVNQNAFKTVSVKSTSTATTSTSIVAGAKEDTIKLLAGSNVTLTPDANAKSITIATKDTTYGVATTSTNGLMNSAMVTKLNGIQSGAEVNQNAYQTIAVKSNSTATATNLVANAKNATVTIVGGNAMSVAVDTTAKTISLGVSTTDVIASNGTLPVVASAVHSALSSKVDSSSLAQVAWTGKYSDLEGKPTTLTPPSQKIDFTSANSTGVSWNSSKTEAVFTHSLDCVPNVTVYDNNWELTYVTIQVGPTPNNSTFRMVLDSPVVSSNAWHCIVTYGHHI